VGGGSGSLDVERDHPAGTAENGIRLQVTGADAVVQINGVAVAELKLEMVGPWHFGISATSGEEAPVDIRFPFVSGE
jgi:hypothetical protein